jgi:uncharacterized protein (DUF433 family)
MGATNPVKIDPEIMHGTPCFAGTRVPVKILFDYLADNRSLDFFLEQYPTVEKEQAIAVLDQAEKLVTRPIESKVA